VDLEDKVASGRPLVHLRGGDVPRIYDALHSPRRFLNIHNFDMVQVLHMHTDLGRLADLQSVVAAVISTPTKIDQCLVVNLNGAEVYDTLSGTRAGPVEDCDQAARDDAEVLRH